MSQTAKSDRSSPEERRRFVRYEVENADLKVNFGCQGKMLDISEGGVRFLTSSWLPPGREVRLWLAKNGSDGALKGEVVRSRLLETEGNRNEETRPVYEVAVALSAHAVSREWVERLSRKGDRSSSERESA